MHTNRIAQYQRVPPLGQTILVALTQLSVDNSILEKEEVDWAVIFLRQNRSGGLYEMREEYHQSCLQS